MNDKDKKLLLSYLKNMINLLRELLIQKNRIDDYFRDNTIDKFIKEIDDKISSLKKDKTIKISLKEVEKDIDIKYINEKYNTEFINSLIKKYNEKEGIIYPPTPLKDEELNKEILSLNLDVPTFLYLRFITHPFKQNIEFNDKVFLLALKEIEGFSERLIRYLIKGTMAQSFDFEKERKIVIKQDPDYESYFKIDKYIQSLDEIIQNKSQEWRDESITFSNEEMSLQIKKKKTIFNEDVSLSYFEEFMKKFYMFYDPILP